MPSYACRASLHPLHHTTKKRAGKCPFANLIETFKNDSLFHQKSNGEDGTQNKRLMWEILNFRILCEISLENKNINL